MIWAKKIKIEGPRMKEKKKERKIGPFYVLSFNPLARHNKQPNPRKLG